MEIPTYESKLVIIVQVNGLTIVNILERPALIVPFYQEHLTVEFVDTISFLRNAKSANPQASSLFFLRVSGTPRI